MGEIKIKTLKSKITIIYIFLVIVITIVGFISAYNIFKLSKAIDGLMTDNYKSINAVSNMRNNLDSEEKAVLRYMQSEKKDSEDLFYKSNDEFYRYFNTEINNVTEAGEKKLVDKTNMDYLNFIKLFSGLQDYQNINGSNSAVQYYNSAIIPAVEKVRIDLNGIIDINETAMFNGKNKAKMSSSRSMYIVILSSVAAALIGLIISIFYTNRTLKPVNMLTETIKSVREGNLNKEVPIINDDEIGMLAKEFNSMTRRLQEFENSTKGTLLEEKNKSITIVKSISEPLIVLNIDYRIMLINKSCESFFNVNEADVHNKHILEAIKNPELYEHIFNAISNNEDEREKIISISRNKKVYYFNTTITPIRKNDAGISEIIVLLKNVTELKQLEKVKTDFIDTISHELKTPLTSIMMGTGLIMDNNIGILNDKQREILTAINEDVERLNDLVSNLLRLSRIQSDKAIFDFKPDHIESVIESSCSCYLGQAEARDIKLFYEIQDNLPEVYIDSEKISWVINNLISNALNYTEAGDEIKAGAYLKNEKVYVYVKDTGEGIPEEYLDKVFDKFVQVKGYYTESMHVGLGLSIAKEIVEAHRGLIWCESKLNEGSTFTFTVPVIDEPFEEE